MKLYDISMAIEPEMMVYKNLESKKPKLLNSANYSNASHYETDIHMNLHTGTHFDAPLHMIEDGDTMEVYNLDQFITQCKVVDLSEVVGMIHKEDLVSKGIDRDDFILLKTRNSFEDTFNPEFISLADDGADYLAELEIKGVGIDALGIERGQPSHGTHKALLSKRIPILEGLQLAEVPEGVYQLIALPIKITGVEAAPTRAVLLEE